MLLSIETFNEGEQGDGLGNSRLSHNKDDLICHCCISFHLSLKYKYICVLECNDNIEKIFFKFLIKL